MANEAQAGGRRAMTLALAAAFLGWMFDGLEQSLFPLVARPALKAMMEPGADISQWFAAIMAVFLFGAACGGVVFGWLGDRIGRVRAMALSVVFYAIFSGLCGFVVAPWQLAVMRFLAALGMGGEWALGVALVMEIWPTKFRPLLAGVIGAAANVGFVFMGLLGLGLAAVIADLHGLFASAGLPPTWNEALLANSGWRLLMFLGATPAFLAILIQIFVPESKRWQHAAALAPKNKVSDVFKPGIRQMVFRGSLLGAIALLGTWGSAQYIPSWADKITDGQVASARPMSIICLGFGAIIGCVFGSLFAQWTNRRIGYFTLSALSLVACQYVFRAPQEYNNWFLFEVVVIGGLTAAFYGWLPLYLPELFPTRIRATGQGFAYNSGRVLAAFGTLGGGQLLHYFKEDYAQMCSAISLVYILGIVFIWFCPETKGRPLPE